MKIKSYTDIEQSKKLAEILPLDTADIVYHKYSDLPHSDDMNLSTVCQDGDNWYWVDIRDECCMDDDIYGWSLSALMAIIPKGILMKRLPEHKGDNKLYVMYDSESSEEYDNPIDAAFELVCWLLENKKL